MKIKQPNSFFYIQQNFKLLDNTNNLIEHLGVVNTEVDASSKKTVTNQSYITNTNTDTSTTNLSNTQQNLTDIQSHNTDIQNLSNKNINNSSNLNLTNQSNTSNVNQSQNVTKYDSSNTLAAINNCGPNIDFGAAQAIVGTLFVDQSVSDVLDASQNVIVRGRGNVLKNISLQNNISKIGPTSVQQCVQDIVNKVAAQSTTSSNTSSSNAGGTLGQQNVGSGGNTSNVSGSNAGNVSNTNASSNSSDLTGSQGTTTGTTVTNSNKQTADVTNPNSTLSGISDVPLIAGLLLTGLYWLNN